MRDNIHDGHSWYLPDPPLEIFIAGSDDVAPVLFDSVDNTVISIGAFVIAF
jgi:hypothetical protein